jgi:hypothetical protein
MKTLILIFVSMAHAQMKPQVVKTQAQLPPAPVAGNPAAAPAPVAQTGRPVRYPVTVQQQPQQQPSQQAQGGQNPLQQMLQNFTNGAGPTGNNWNSGTPSGSPGSTGARGIPFDMVGAGLCGQGQDIWSSAKAVMDEGVIPPNQGYNINAPNWPKLTGTAPNQLRCDFSPGKQSMCTSATAAAICQHFASLSNSGKMQLTAAQVAFLNGPQVKAAINGNTFSVAYLFQHLGGSSLHGKGANIREVLAQAKTGDVLRIDRTSGTGHSTIFKEIKGDQFCYWTSNTGTNGAGVQCENISSLSQVVVSRFPADVAAVPARIDQMVSGMHALNSTSANAMQASSIRWATALDCKREDGPVNQRAGETSPSAVAIH